MKQLSILLVLLCLCMPIQLLAKSCRPYIPYIKKYSEMYISNDFQYAYLVAQDYQESNCRFVISYDGIHSESPAQITWRWWKKYLKPYGIYNLKTIPNFTKAQVLIMKKLIFRSQKKYGKVLWIPFQVYNGGWLVAREIKRAGTINQQTVKKYCHRKIIHFKNGKTLKACNINYDYPHKIERWTNKYYSDLLRKSSYKMWNKQNKKENKCLNYSSTLISL